MRGAARWVVGDLLARVARGPRDGRVLLYHRIEDDGDPVLSVPKMLFRTHLDWLESAGLRPAPVGSERGEGFPSGIVGISFDDGDISAAVACAELAARGGGATLFVVPRWIGRPLCVGWTDLRELAAAGMEIGAHGLDHEALLAGDVGRMATSLREARERLQDGIGVDIEGIAYPYGIAPRRARAAAAMAGFAYGCTSRPGANRSRNDPLSLNRNEVLPRDSTERLFLGKLSGSDDWMGPVRVLESRWQYGA